MNKKIKILYLYQYFVTDKGKWNVRCYEFAKRLSKAGYEPIIITSNHDRLDIEVPPKKKVLKTNIEDIDIWIINTKYSQSFGRIKRILSFLMFSLKCIFLSFKIKDFDIIYASSPPLTIAIPAIFISCRRKKPLIFEVRDLWPDVPIKLGILKNKLLIKLSLLLEKFAYKVSKHIIVLSPPVKEKIIEKGIDKSKISIIPNGSDITYFRIPREVGEKWRKKHPEFNGKKLLVYAGSFGYANGLDYVVELAKYTANKEPKLFYLLIGEGSEKKKITEFAKEEGLLNKNLFIMDSLQRNYLPEVLSAADIVSSFVIDNPAMYDNSANKFFDGFAAGKPIAINYLGWQANLLKKTGAGIILDPKDIEKAARELIIFINDEERLKQTGLASSKCADIYFSREKLFEKLRNIINMVKGL